MTSFNRSCWLDSNSNSVSCITSKTDLELGTRNHHTMKMDVEILKHSKWKKIEWCSYQVLNVTCWCSPHMQQTGRLHSAAFTHVAGTQHKHLKWLEYLPLTWTQGREMVWWRLDVDLAAASHHHACQQTRCTVNSTPQVCVSELPWLRQTISTDSNYGHIYWALAPLKVKKLIKREGVCQA